MQRVTDRLPSRTGLTVLEVLVAIGIVGLIAALVTPAVQQVRASSRRVRCSNNLRQVGQAMSSIAESDGRFPTSQQPKSAHLRLLPYLDGQNLYDAITTGVSPSSWIVPALACPDDEVVAERMRQVGDANYYLNLGTQFSRRSPEYNGFCKSHAHDTGVREITDGASQTVAFSERLVRPTDAIRFTKEQLEAQPRRFFWWTETRYYARNEALAVDNCLNHRTTPIPQSAGVNMGNYQAAHGYNHLLAPNAPSCYNGPEDMGADFQLMLVSASSNHRGGVNALMVDGSCHFVNNSILPEVWAALGTRAGQDLVGNGAWW